VKSWDAPFSVEDANDAALEFAEMLVKGSEIHTIPRVAALSRTALDYSLQSIEQIEDYLLNLHQYFVKWVKTGVLPIKAFGFRSKRDGQNQLADAVFQCGSYIGEVIRRTKRQDLHWIRHQEWSKIASKSDLDLIGRSASVGTTLMLTNQRQELWLPFEKTLKFLEFGIQDSVFSFAAVVSEHQAA
jgi:hypothetical protein